MMKTSLTRRSLLSAALGATALFAPFGPVLAQKSALTFDKWVERFGKRALARGVSPAVYDRVMNGLKPDTSVYALDRAQPEFNEKPWQYLNRRVSDWRISDRQGARQAICQAAGADRG